MKTRSVQWYGWQPDHPDRRDKFFFAAPAPAGGLPAKVSLRDQMPQIWNQGKLGSCTAHGILACDRFVAAKQLGTPQPMLSRLMLYYLERAYEHTVSSDSGAQIRDGIKMLAKFGTCPEVQWPYDIAKFAVKPPTACFVAAAQQQALEYFRINTGDVANMKRCLAEGFPFTFGFMVYAQFESAECTKTGLVRVPPQMELPLGGHCVAAIGYDDAKQMGGYTGFFEVRNSWGATWGDAGHGWMPYDYFGKTILAEGLTQDFWTIRRVE